MSDKNHPNDRPGDSRFEQKLAAHKPRILRDVKAAVMREMQRETQTLPMPIAQSRPSFEQTVRPYLLVGVCCFLLGAAVMYGVMCCFFDRGPTRSGPLLAAETQQTQTVYTMPLSMRDLDEVRTPADLARQLRRQPTVTIDNAMPVETPYTQRDILRAFGDVSRI